MTTKSRAANASKGLPVNHCSGFRSPRLGVLTDIDGIILLIYLVWSIQILLPNAVILANML